VFQVHKPGQGKLSRAVALLGGVFLIAWGCRSLVFELPELWTDASMRKPLGESWNVLLGNASSADAWRVDLVVHAGPFSPAFTVAAVALIAGSLGWWALLNRPRVADQLVEMEAEMHKVSWPSLSDAWQSTLVVSGFTALVVVLVFAYDIVIKLFVELMPRRGV
jgi:preprotein translocase SecE subunit